MTPTRRKTLRRRGQGMTEYIIIVALIALAAGEHFVKLALEGYVPSVNQVVMEVGKSRTLDVPLLAEPRFYERWYFWAVVGLGAAAITGGVLAAVIERRVDPGTLGGPFGAGSAFGAAF